ncbi:hypothetical protein AGLY_010616 [Aphis glycines]|uniref:Receptor ligand binding region domain-containing protein n=1 Tax=Aphis glycines TaxID=307491 RepID=A0A6G0TFD6_APHGL|nr:hypothetical protein AGLY_010616 [Aphis glycines]
MLQKSRRFKDKSGIGHVSRDVYQKKKKKKRKIPKIQLKDPILFGRIDLKLTLPNQSNHDLDLFLGPVCDYVIAPVSRYAGVWKIPVLTAGALAENFDKRSEYPTLTRMMGSYKLVGEAIRYTLHQFNWTVAGLLYYTHELSSPMGNSKCHFMLSAVYLALGLKPEYRSFQDTDNIESFKKLLTELSLKARNSERSDECIDFTMIITSRNNASITNYWGGVRCKSEYPWCIIEFSKKSRKTKKNNGKMAIFTQNQFSTKSIFFMVRLWFKFLRNLSKTRKFHNDNDLSQTILNICYYSKMLIKFVGPIKILENFIQSSSYVILIHLKFKFRQKFVKIMNICKLFCRPLKHKPPFSPTTGNYILG